jgi:RNA polymerase sigma-70 factor (family 1)
LPQSRSNSEDHTPLFHRLAQGDDEAFSHLFHLYAPRLISFMRRITRDEEVARELLQDVFVTIWEKRSYLDKIENPSAWLHRVAANACLMHLRSAGFRKRALAQMQHPVVSAGQDPAAILEGRDMATRVETLVQLLPEKRRTIYLLSRTQGLSHAEIAQRLDISVQTVKNQMVLALRTLARLLGNHSTAFLLFFLD